MTIQFQNNYTNFLVFLVICRSEHNRDPEFYVSHLEYFVPATVRLRIRTGISVPVAEYSVPILKSQQDEYEFYV